MNIVRDKEERKLKKVKINLMRNPIFALWSGIMMVGKTSVVDDIPTARTDGRDEEYGRELVKLLDEKMLGFVVLHENLHKAFRHLTTWQKLYKEWPEGANMACDYVINLILYNLDKPGAHITPPRIKGKDFVLLDQRFAGMNTKQVFDILKQEAKKQGGGPGTDQPIKVKGNAQGGFDVHDWGAAKELSDGDKKELEREIDQALRQGEMAHRKACGKGAGDMNREIGDLLESKIPWQEELREFVNASCNAKDTSSWRKVNRRFLSQDMYMPTLIGERMGEVVFGLDTSGSIGQEDLTAFLSEAKAIIDQLHPEKVHLIYWDTRVAAHETYDEVTMGSMAESTKPRGGGGTDPTCMMHYLKQENINPVCIIQLTDGEIGDWGNDWNAPILWAIRNNYRGSRIMAPVGKTLHIED